PLRAWRALREIFFFENPSTLRKRASRQVFGRAFGAHDIVFDADAAVRLEVVDGFPVDVLARFRATCPFEKTLDEVDAGLDRHDEARCKGSCESQVGVLRRLLPH